MPDGGAPASASSLHLPVEASDHSLSALLERFRQIATHICGYQLMGATTPVGWYPLSSRTAGADSGSPSLEKGSFL